MAYCIMRIEKRKRSALYGLQIEANRVTARLSRDFSRDISDLPKNEKGGTKLLFCAAFCAILALIFRASGEKHEKVVCCARR